MARARGAGPLPHPKGDCLALAFGEGPGTSVRAAQQLLSGCPTHLARGPPEPSSLLGTFWERKRLAV